MLSTGGCGLQRDPRRAGARGPAPGTQFPPPGTQFPPPRITCGTRQGGGSLPTRDGGALRASALPPGPGWCWLGAGRGASWSWRTGELSRFIAYASGHWVFMSFFFFFTILKIELTLHNIKGIVFKCVGSVVVPALTMFCNRHHHLVPEDSHPPQKEPRCLLAVTSHAPASIPVLVDAPALDASHEWGHTTCGPSRLASLA